MQSDVHCKKSARGGLHSIVLALGSQSPCGGVSMILLVSDIASGRLKNRVPRRSSQDSIYREREPEAADRGSDGDDANETCAAGAGLMSRNSLKTSAVGAS